MALVLDLPCADCKKAARESLPSHPIFCLLSPTRLREGPLRECCSRILHHRESTWVRHSENSQELTRAKDGYTVDTRSVSDGHRPNHGNPQTGMLSTISTSSHSSTCYSISSDSRRMICCVRLLSSRHTVSTNAVAP